MWGPGERVPSGCGVRAQYRGPVPGVCAAGRAHSVAADTLLDDPRTYRVYLAWFGPGMVKVGITREERGAARLREQGAVAFTWLGRGPHGGPADRGGAAGRPRVPDRIPYARKRAVRGRLPGEQERLAEVGTGTGGPPRFKGVVGPSRWSPCLLTSSIMRKSSGWGVRPAPRGP
ncbi:hypothetical protein SMICM304S_07997 [Streptomyces microflavus]